MALRTGNRIFNTVRRYSNNTYVESKTLDFNVLENTYGGDVEAYLNALYPTMSTQQSSDLANTQTVEDLDSCPTCTITVSILPLSTESRALTVGGFWPDNNPTIWLSKDLGDTWVRQYRDTNRTNVIISDISFPTGNAAYVVLSDGNVMKSVDGGNTWNNLTLPVTASWSSCFFTNSLTGYVIGSGTILKTIDGGSNWSNIPNPSSNTDFTKVYCVNNNDMETYVVGDTLLVLKTEDGGLTWSDNSPVSTQPLADTITDISMESSQFGYFIVNGGTIYETTDFGVTWSAVANPSGAGWSIHVTLEEISYAGHSPYKITKTNNSWITATITPGNVMFYPNSIASSYTNTNLLLVAGEATQQNNFIFKTIDGFTSKYAVASEAGGAGNASAIDIATYSSVTVLRFSIAGATTTVTAKLLLTDNTVIATKSNLFNGINSFSNVVENIYKIRIIDDGDNTCIFTSDLYNYSISYCVTLATTSQINSEKTSIVYWKVVIIDGSLVNKDIVVSGIISPGNDLVTFTILAGSNSATLIKTYTKAASDVSYTLTLQTGTSYVLCDLTTISITVSQQYGNIYASGETIEPVYIQFANNTWNSNTTKRVNQIEPKIYYYTDGDPPSAEIVLWKKGLNDALDDPFLGLADNDPIITNLYRRDKFSLEAWGTNPPFQTFSPYVTATDSFTADTSTYDYLFESENF